MNRKGIVLAYIIFLILLVILIITSNYIWPNEKWWIKIFYLVISAIIVLIINKTYDYCCHLFKSKNNEPYLGVSIKIDNVLRKFVGYGASCDEVIQAGHFKANYEVNAELIIIVQNESPYPAYEVDVRFQPNDYSRKYTLVDLRQNKLQPLEGNKHFEFKLQITNVYYDMYALDVDLENKKLYRLGKGISILNGSKIIINYRDSNHGIHTATEVIS